MEAGAIQIIVVGVGALSVCQAPSLFTGSEVGATLGLGNDRV